MDEFITEYENIRIKTLFKKKTTTTNAIFPLHAGAGGNRVLSNGVGCCTGMLQPLGG